MHKFLFYNKLILYSSTCFEHCCAHHQEVRLYYTASGIVTLCRWPSGAHRTAIYTAHISETVIDILRAITCAFISDFDIMPVPVLLSF